MPEEAIRAIATTVSPISAIFRVVTFAILSIIALVCIPVLALLASGSWRLRTFPLTHRPGIVPVVVRIVPARGLASSFSFLL